MLTISADVIDTIEDTVQDLSYRLGDNCDDWYPSKTDIDKLRPIKKKDLPFLLWCMHPRNELTKDQNEVRKYIQQVIAEEVVFDEEPSKTPDDKAAKLILSKYGF